MKLSKTLILGASALVIGFTVPAMAADYTSEFVEDVSLTFPGYAAQIEIENMSGNKHVSAVNPVVKTSNLEFDINGTVKCKSANKVEFRNAWAFFGPLFHAGSQGVKTDAALHNQEVDVAYHEKGNLPEYTEDTFVVPYNKIKQGHPAIRVDALEELNKKLEAHVQGGGDPLEFWQNDQDIVLQRPISLMGSCGNNTENSAGFVKQDATIQIKYKGDPAVNDKPVINAQLAQNGGMPGQVNNDFPIQIVNASFQPNMPHYTGKCVPDQNTKIRINFQLSGSEEGLMDLRVVPDSSNVYGTTYGPYATFNSIPVNVQHSKKVDFSFPLIEMLSQNQYSYMAEHNSKTWSHNMRLEGRIKPKNGGQWSAWEELDTAVFKHRCTPQVNFQMGGNKGGKVGFDNGNDGNGGPAIQGTVKATPENGSGPAIDGKLQAVPVKPTSPNDKVRAPAKPVPQLQIKSAQ